MSDPDLIDECVAAKLAAAREAWEQAEKPDCPDRRWQTFRAIDLRRQAEQMDPKHQAPAWRGVK